MSPAAPATGRFAPSPTGPLHVGNLRTALLAWLRARSQGARFLVRIEDLDPVASRDEWVGEHLADLAALGLDHDGPVERQSSSALRAGHELALRRLEQMGVLYPCFCTRREVAEAAAAPHGPWPEGAYPGTCRELDATARAARVAAGRRPSWRVRAGAPPVTVVDLVRGPVTAVVDDFVVRRGDGVPAYNLAVVVDDGAQGVTEVVRGDDLLAGTPRQVWLAGVLGLAPPAHVHVPLVLGPDGERLAKRHGAVTLGDLRQRGVGPEEVLARLATGLGLAAPGERPTAAELVPRFDLAALPREPWVWT